MLQVLVGMLLLQSRWLPESKTHADLMALVAQKPAVVADAHTCKEGGLGLALGRLGRVEGEGLELGLGSWSRCGVSGLTCW